MEHLRSRAALWIGLSGLLLCFLLTGCGVGREAKAKEQLERGQSYLQAAAYEDALDAFTKAIELDPENGSAFVQRGDTYMAMERYTDAVVDYEAANHLGERVSQKLEIAIGEAVRQISMESDIDTAMRWLEEVQS